MKIVMLDRNSLGMDMDISIYGRLGEFEAHDVADRNSCREWIRDADIVIFNKTVMDEDLLKDAGRVRLLCVTATGYDNIDLEYARKRKIGVSNVRNYSTPAVAQHTFAMVLYLLEKISYYDGYVKSGAYSGQMGFSNFDEHFTELEGKTWGILGMGNIGKRVASIARSFGCNVITHSVSGTNTGTEYEQTSLEDLLLRADILSLHCPLTEKTRNLMNKDTLGMMKPTAILINVARGPVVNDGDLYEALEKGVIAGAGLDVLSKEPMEKENPLGKIKDSRKLLITPHMAWASVESRTRCLQEVYANIEAFLEGEERNRVD